MIILFFKTSSSSFFKQNNHLFKIYSETGKRGFFSAGNHLRLFVGGALKMFKKILDKTFCFMYNNQVANLGVAQFGSVLEWGSRGREFKSPHSDQQKPLNRWG